MSEDYTLVIIDALEKIAHYSITLNDVNDEVAGQATRVMNVYSRFIGSKFEGKSDKKAYDKAKLVMLQCNTLSEMINGLKELVTDLLNTIGEINEKE